VQFSAAQQQLVDRLLNRFSAAPYATPSVKECQAEVSEDVYTSLIEAGQLLQVSPEVVFRKTDFDAMQAAVRQHLLEQGTLTLAQFRDRFQTSRKYAQAFLEYLDAGGVTMRDGDARKLAKR
jgi:selenocysteine-specific elongation factor